MVSDFEPADLARDFARALEIADSRRPIAVNARSGQTFQPGIGPHSEAAATRLVLAELAELAPDKYSRYAVGVSYPNASRQKCDVCFGDANGWKWGIEMKLVRLLGDNGKLNDNMVMHLLSPYPAHRSALTDCLKLVSTSFSQRKAVLVYGFETEEWPLAPLVAAFETLASKAVLLGPRAESGFAGLVHPIHRSGAVFVWEVFS